MGLIPWFAVVILLGMTWMTASRRRRRSQSQCYLLNYVCYKPPNDRKTTVEMAAAVAERNQRLGLREFRYLLRLYNHAGIGDQTCPI